MKRPRILITPDVSLAPSSLPPRLPKPRTIRNVDGTKNSIGAVTEAVNLDMVSHNGKKDTHVFYIIDLGEDHMPP